jgi:N6-adenosine-specific RNA methylase IME4
MQPPDHVEFKPFPEKKYTVIYADPPWDYGLGVPFGMPSCKSVREHYPTLSQEQICSLPVQEIADNDCMLFLWVTFPKLQDGLDVIKRWGFTYISVGFTWIKKNKKSGTPFFGMGYWTRGNAEICLMGRKGSPKRHSQKVSSIIESPYEWHSKKPDITRDKIVELMGDVPRIELIARQSANGWYCWGNEV